MTEIAEEILFSSQTQPENEQISILKRHFPNCFDKQGAFLPEKMAETLQSNGIKTEKESYSLNWLGKSYAKILKDRQPETLLAEDIEHNQKPENQNSENVLIQGDNLEVLKHLKHAYKNQIKMIYIDPPYNTGSDGFVYQDDRKFTPQQLVELGMDLEEAKRVLEFTAKKSNSHSAWLTFMYPRLKVAHDLLKDDGVIFISIDDNEQAQLKLLCDEVFGEENFVAECIHKNNSSKNQAKFIGVSTEYLYVYAKSVESLTATQANWRIRKEGAKDIALKFKQLKSMGLSIEEIDNEIKEMYKRPKYAHLSRWNKVDEKGVFKDADLSRQGGRKDYTIINPNTGKPCVIPERGWDKSYDDLLALQKANLIWYGDENTPPSVKSYISEDDYSVADNFWYFDSSSGTKLIKQFFCELVFENPKPLNMIKRAIELGADENAVILDFFAGSGTTAHAVMQLNAEDKGNRKFICVQLPEPTNEKSEAYKAGYKTIFDITKARIEKSAVKIRQDFQEITADLGFKIFKTEPHFQTALNTDFDPQIDFLPKNNLTDEQLHQLLTTWRVFDGCRLTEKVETVDLAGYTAYYCRQHLYLLASGFTSESVKALIEHLDNDRDFVPERIVLFGENIDSAMQKELAQAVKTYANKKGLNNLSVLARY
ncbi:putative methyltransferase [Haemophilus influenzae]|uniref:site-specific DNA-methyltransferase n=1 Tax=Haemophilus influenzae TaxID=727 RepID=UPI000CFF352F|nr:site-specific DNA-methyltransferase [Haemophilus influenzae]PRI43517.1 putative methyltransferase [Haemophilus influenzae]PRK14506.1 putative methyltransferase [Haemophilus influenzae]PRM40719.1 putative methyltransferase [Haemophilus influenzae]